MWEIQKKKGTLKNDKNKTKGDLGGGGGLQQRSKGMVSREKKKKGIGNKPTNRKKNLSEGS